MGFEPGTSRTPALRDIDAFNIFRQCLLIYLFRLVNHQKLHNELTLACVYLFTVELTSSLPIRCVGDFQCDASCRHGYQCGKDGCPTCDCISGA